MPNLDSSRAYLIDKKLKHVHFLNIMLLTQYALDNLSKRMDELPDNYRMENGIA
jgi:hypothetical protein